MVETLDLKLVERLVCSVSDPEIPILTIEDLGILRDINVNDEGIVVVITPTYVGCPAMDMISADIQSALAENGFDNVSVETSLSPAWTTDWLTDSGREKLLSIGIAPPNQTAQTKRALMSRDGPAMCPRCHSTNTECISEFGSTACKALHRCVSCLEPFDYFKCI